MKPFCILLTCDKHYLKFALFVAWQLNSQAIRNFDVVIASDDDSIESSLPEYIKFLYLEDVDIWKNIAVNDRFGYFAYLRLPAIELLSPRYKRILYIDSDIFIHSKNISNIFKIEMNDYPLCAIRDSQQRFNLSNEVLDFKKNGLPNSRYFNSGVLLINSRQWQNGHYYKKICNALQTYPYPTILHDQTLLNLIFYENWLEISPKWNWMSGPLTSFASEYFKIHMFHGKTWINDPKRIPVSFHDEFVFYNDNFNFLDRVKIEMISDKKYYSIYWRSLALNLRWSFAAIRWLKRFETDFSVIPP